MATIKECFDTILRGDKNNSRLAARGVRKLVYSSSAAGREKYEQIAALIESAPEINPFTVEKIHGRFQMLITFTILRELNVRYFVGYLTF